MNNFNYYTPTKVVFGKDTVKQVGELISQYGGTKVLIHYGGQSAIRSGLIDQVKEVLKQSDIEFVELPGVVPNPHISKVYEGIELCKKEGVDFLLPVGGGSVIDSAKAIAYGLAEPEYDVWELYEHTRSPKACFPLGAILTIAAAGSEMSDSSVITDEKTGKKRGCNSDLCRAKFAIMDPTYTLTLPDYQTMSGCVDIMMHTMERYFTQGLVPNITDSIATGLIQTVMKHAQILHADPTNYNSRYEVMWASSLSHNGLTGCGHYGGDWSSHRLEHEMGGMFDVTHGAGLAAIWSSWARYVYKDCMERFIKFSIEVMGVQDQEDKEAVVLQGIEKMEAFFHSIDMPTNMKELGIEPSEEQIKTMALGCQAAVGGTMGSAKVLGLEDFETIYRNALGD